MVPALALPFPTPSPASVEPLVAAAAAVRAVEQVENYAAIVTLARSP